MNEIIPDSVRNGLTNRQWKSLKRRQLKAVRKALDEYRLGCAWCPRYNKDIAPFDDILERMEESHSVKNWGR